MGCVSISTKFLHLTSDFRKSVVFDVRYDRDKLIKKWLKDKAKLKDNCFKSQ